MPELIGKDVGRYHIIEQCGMGGMAVVYCAYDTRLEREVALKIIRRSAFSPDVVERMLKRFEREAKSLAKLTHPNIVPIIDYGEHEGSPFLVMPLISGGTLKLLLENRLTSGLGPYGSSEAARLLSPIAHALDYAHRREILHRDVKPSNILITDNNDPLLTDFGIAKILEEGEGATLTGTGVGIGTPEYMAPEQWLGKSIPASDQYSLGVVLYELVTGCKPYTADTPAAILLKQATDTLPRPRATNSEIPEEVERVIFKSLAKKPEDRYASMADFASALEKLARLDDRQPARTAAAPAKPKPQPVPATQPQPAADPEATYDGTPTPHSPLHTINKKGVPVWVWGLGGLILLGFVGLGLRGVIDGKPEPTAAHLSISTKTSFTTPTFNPASILTPSLGIGSSMIWEKDSMEMKYVPAGEFKMGADADQGYDICQQYQNGCDRNWFADEQPIHTVYLDAYWMDKFEVTNAQYEQCVLDGVCQTSNFKDDSEFNGSNQPVVGVNWENAKAYCEWAGRRLPTEAEWENGARGTESRIYPWGDEFDCSKGNFDDETTQDPYISPGGAGCDGHNTTAPVGYFKAGQSEYGLMDTAGNVCEWTADWYGKYYYDSPERNNPQGPSNGEYRVVRGSSWGNDDPYFIRSALRRWENPEIWFNYLGFRCAVSQ